MLFFLFSEVTECDLFGGVIDLFLLRESADLSMLVSRSVGLDASTLFRWSSFWLSPCLGTESSVTAFASGSIAAEADVCMSLIRLIPIAADGVAIGLLFLIMFWFLAMDARCPLLSITPTF